MPQFQLKLLGLSQGVDDKELGSILSQKNISNIAEVRKQPKWQHAFVRFDNEEAYNIASQQIPLQLQCTVEEDKDGYVKPGKRRSGNSANTRKKSKIADGPEHERLNDQVTPLWRLPYEQQLERKQAVIRSLIEGNSLFKGNQLLDIVPSPDKGRLNYRTKCEFSIGKGLNSDLVECGFMLGDYHSGRRFVSDPAQCLHVNKDALKVVASVRDFVRESSLPSYDRESNSGFWRTLVVRSHTQETMVIMMVSQRGLNNDQIGQIAAEKQRFIQYLQGMKDIITTLLWTSNEAMHDALNTDSTFEVLTGEGIIRDSLQNLSAPDCPQYTFRISPMSFYQSNATTCPLLYKVIGDWIEQPLSLSTSTKKKILIDACCGTGTIGIIMSSLSNVKAVYGIESCAPALEDAKLNAQANDIQNVHYVCDTVEDGLEKLLAIIDLDAEDEVVLVLDPPRAGVHRKVIKAIKRCMFINRIIYVSCNPKAACQNWNDLCSPVQSLSKYKNRIGYDNSGPPLLFEMLRSQAVDMFPQTDHCELVLEFGRIKE